METISTTTFGKYAGMTDTPTSVFEPNTAAEIGIDGNLGSLAFYRHIGFG